jgi:hypothetical protein
LNGQTLYVLPESASPWWYLARIAVVFALASAMLIGALTFFGRVEGNFAEEL